MLRGFLGMQLEGGQMLWRRGEVLRALLLGRKTWWAQVSSSEMMVELLEESI